jgi:hypothetical protein
MNYIHIQVRKEYQKIHQKMRVHKHFHKTGDSQIFGT